MASMLQSQGMNGNVHTLEGFGRSHRCCAVHLCLAGSKTQRPDYQDHGLETNLARPRRKKPVARTRPRIARLKYHLKQGSLYFPIKHHPHQGTLTFHGPKR